MLALPWFDSIHPDTFSPIQQALKAQMSQQMFLVLHSFMFVSSAICLRYSLHITCLDFYMVFCCHQREFWRFEVRLTFFLLFLFWLSSFLMTPFVQLKINSLGLDSACSPVSPGEVFKVDEWFKRFNLTKIWMSTNTDNSSSPFTLNHTWTMPNQNRMII